MTNFSRRQSVGIVAILVLLTIVVGIFSFRPASSSPGIVFQEAPTQAPVSASPETAPPVSEKPGAAAPAVLPLPRIAVHVTGAVKKPGVYHLPMDARHEDALKAAGGAKPEANLDALNLAARVEDGVQLYFPTRQEQPKGMAQAAYDAGEAAVVSVAKPATKTTAPAAKSAEPSSSRTRRSSGKLTTPGQGFVNINTADAQTLQKLPNIGPAMAERILAFRKEIGKFQAPEDLLQVSGIGEKKFAKMKPFVRVK